MDELDNLFADVFAEKEPESAPEKEPESAPEKEPEKEPEKSQEKEPEKDPETKENEMSSEERARQAHGRRMREQKAYEAGYQQARKEMDDLLKRLPITNDRDEAIETVEKLEAYDKAESDKRLASGNGNAEDFRRIVREEMRAAQPQKPAISAEEKARMDREIAEIHGMDPSINTLDDIMKSDAAPKFVEYVNKGLSFLDSYTLAAKDRLAGISAKREAKGGKDHLNATNQRGAGALSVPAAEMAIFRELNPGASEAEIQKFYNADRKRYGPK